MLIRDEGYGYKPASVVLPRISANSFWDQQPGTIETQRDGASPNNDNIRYIPGPPGPPGPPGAKGNNFDTSKLFVVKFLDPHKLGERRDKSRLFQNS